MLGYLTLLKNRNSPYIEIPSLFHKFSGLKVFESSYLESVAASINSFILDKNPVVESSPPSSSNAPS